MEAAAHARSATVAGVLKAEVLEDIVGALDEALAEGKTYQQFLQKLQPKLKARGWWGKVPADPETGEVQSGRSMTPHRLRHVYQMNLQSSYMAGRNKAQLENADQRPYWQYVAVMDHRTRPAHRSLNGRTFRYDDPAWGALYPPNGHKCRCRVKALSSADFEAEGVVLSRGEGRMETNEIDLGGKRGKVSVTGYRDPGTNTLFAPDPGFDHSPGRGAYGLDIELARKVQAMKRPEIRSQVWQGLNGSPERLADYHGWMNRVLDAGRAGSSAQVVGFVDDRVASFMAAQRPEVEPVRVLAINEKRLLHADSVRHQADGIALTRDQYAMLPGVLAKPDAVYFDTLHRNFVYVRQLADDGVIYVAVDVAYNVKKVGVIDALVNAYRLPGTAEGAGRLASERYLRMGK
nr:phage minor head protein [Azonexus sp. R2A61]